MEGRSTMRSSGDNNGGIYIDGNYYAVYAIGTNKPEQFVVEEWFAISSKEDATVYEYDVVMDTWNVYDDSYNDFEQAKSEDVSNCIYMLNEYVTHEFGVEYYDDPKEVKQAIFKEKVYDTPDKLIGALEEIPEGYYYDVAARSYYPVYNFTSYDSFIEYFSKYFTTNRLEEMKISLEEEFFEMDGTLYLVRAGMGYASVSLDFDAIDDTQFSDEGIIIVDRLLFGEKEGTFKVQFRYENNILKIDSFEQH